MTTSFLGLSDDSLKALSRNASISNAPANAQILGEGERTENLYVILAGRVKVFVADEGGRELILNEHGPGECFGEMVLDDGPRSASVLTLEPSRFLVIPRSDVEEFLRAHPDFAMQLVRQLIQHVRRLTDKARGLALESVYRRLARLLYELSVEENGRRIVRGRHTHGELASHVGASREMISRVMKDLTTGEYVRVEDDGIVILKTLPRNW